MQTIFLDTETTGLTTGRDQILELAIVDDDGDVLINQRFKPTRIQEWPDAQKINGISPEDLVGCPHFADYIEKIQNIISAARRVVGYNTYFDLRMLHGEGVILGKHTTVIDIMTDFAKIYGEWDQKRQAYRRQKLSTCANFYHYNWSGMHAHGALADTLATKHCYEKMRDEGVYL